jgi:hypothetical protein
MTVLRTQWVPLALFAAAGVLWLDPLPYASVVPAASRIPAHVTDTTPVRRPGLVPQYRAAGFIYRCSDCHAIIPSPRETYRTLVQHTEIQLRHGLNTRCFNCHHRTDRDSLVDDFGNAIPWTQPQLVCAKCHGPVYRDWLAGSHGRVNGYWDASRGPQTRRKCIECHDPHTPPFPSLRPAPGPNTLRMGPPAPVHEAGTRDPLRIYTTHPIEAAKH